MEAIILRPRLRCGSVMSFAAQKLREEAFGRRGQTGEAGAKKSTEAFLPLALHFERHDLTILTTHYFEYNSRVDRRKGIWNNMNRYSGGPSKATSSTLCQKCLKKGHFSYECKASQQDRPYISRPSRTQQLANPKLAPKITNSAPKVEAPKYVWFFFIFANPS